MLAACSNVINTQEISPEEIISNAAMQMQNLNAVHAEFSGFIINKTTDTDQSIRFNGNGDIIIDLAQYSINASFETQSGTSGAAAKTLSGVLDVFINTEETFYKISNLTYPKLNLELTEQNEDWYKVENTQGVSNGMRYINPNLYTVKKYNGVTASNGENSHHLEVVLNNSIIPELQAFTGVTLTAQLWIDTTTFNVNRIGWDIKTKDQANELSLQIDLTQHNNVSPVNAPTNYIDSSTAGESTLINPDKFIEELLQEVR